MKSNKSTSLIGENTDQLVLSLHHASNNDGKNLYFYLDKASLAIIYDINAIKKSLGNDIATVFCSFMISLDVISLLQFLDWGKTSLCKRF